MNKEHKGTIKNARRVDRGDSTYWVEGNVYGHVNFRAGEYIHTSTVLSVVGNEIETRNSLYTAEWMEVPKETSNPALLKHIAEQFVSLIDAGNVMNDEFIEYFHSAFKDALGR